MVNQNNSASEVLSLAQSDDKNLMNIAQYLKNVHLGHKRVIPPVEQWKPEHCGTMDLVVKANGEWWHEGQIIKRQALLDLFSSVLWKENEKFYLKTPAEQIEIQVEDEPLLVDRVDQIEIEGRFYLQLMTTNQDIVVVDPKHLIFMRPYQNEIRPYIHVRFGLNALIQRHVFFHLIEYGELLENEQGDAILSLQSGDFKFELGTCIS